MGDAHPACRMHLMTLLVVLVLALGISASALAQIACAPATTAQPASPTPAASPVPAAAIAFPAEPGTLEVFAAASLVDAFGAIEADLEGAHPGLDIIVTTAGSQTLVTHLTEGAEADVLATANMSTMDDAGDAGLITGKPTVFTGNRLVIVAPEDNPAGIASIDDLATDGLNLVLAGSDVPVGSYSREVLCAYAASGQAPTGFIDAVAANVVSEELDVRSVLTKVQLGEADAGLVYTSDAAAAELAGTPVTIVAFPDFLATAAVYPIAPVAGGDTSLAEAFIAYVLDPGSQATLEVYGFVLP